MCYRLTSPNSSAFANIVCFNHFVKCPYSSEEEKGLTLSTCGYMKEKSGVIVGQKYNCYDVEIDVREIYPSIVGEKMLVGRTHILQCFLSFCDRQLFVLLLTAPHGKMESCVEKLIKFA